MKKERNFWLDMVFIIVSIAVAVFFGCLFSGCNTVKLDSKRIAKIAHRNPQIIAKQCFKDYPCIKVQSDTIRDSIDNVVFIECDTMIIHDSLVEVVPVLKKVIVKGERITVTEYVKDSAEYFLFHETINNLDIELNAANTRLQKQSDTIDSQRKIIAHKGKENWIWRIIALALIGFNIFRFAKKIKV